MTRQNGIRCPINSRGIWEAWSHTGSWRWETCKGREEGAPPRSQKAHHRHLETLMSRHIHRTAEQRQENRAGTADLTQDMIFPTETLCFPAVRRR